MVPLYYGSTYTVAKCPEVAFRRGAQRLVDMQLVSREALEGGAGDAGAVGEGKAKAA